MVSTEIVDILAAAGIQTPDISILSDEFLLEVQQIEKKNLGLEALCKLFNHSIRSRTTRTNVVETRAFTERLEDAIARYHANAITTAEVLQELIKLAQDIRAARNRGEEQGLSDEEIAFYDALAENESALQVMGDDKLRTDNLRALFVARSPRGAGLWAPTDADEPKAVPLSWSTLRDHYLLRRFERCHPETAR